VDKQEEKSQQMNQSKRIQEKELFGIKKSHTE